jgi:hypothetical protein
MMSLLNEDGTPYQGLETEERTESGLVVPKGTIEKTHRAVTNASWKLIRRTVREWNEVNVRMALMCNECETMLQPQENEKCLECNCSKWKLPGWSPVTIETEVPNE